MTHKIEHPYQDRMLVPLTAITGNIDFLSRRDRETRLECTDGKTCRVGIVRTISALSDEFDELLQSIYGRKQPQDVFYFIKKWYKKLDFKFHSFEFIYIETYEPDAETVSN